jgi:hypothetical protein
MRSAIGITVRASEAKTIEVTVLTGRKVSSANVAIRRGHETMIRLKIPYQNSSATRFTSRSAPAIPSMAN